MQSFLRRGWCKGAADYATVAGVDTELVVCEWPWSVEASSCFQPCIFSMKMSHLCTCPDQGSEGAPCIVRSIWSGGLGGSCALREAVTLWAPCRRRRAVRIMERRKSSMTITTLNIWLLAVEGLWHTAVG